jgi:hypothetical protein
MLQLNQPLHNITFRFNANINKIQLSTVSKLLKNKYNSQLSPIRSKIQLTAPPVTFYGDIQSFYANRAPYASQAVSEVVYNAVAVAVVYDADNAVGGFVMRQESAA